MNGMLASLEAELRFLNKGPFCSQALTARLHNAGYVKRGLTASSTPLSSD